MTLLLSGTTVYHLNYGRIYNDQERCQNNGLSTGSHETVRSYPRKAYPLLLFECLIELLEKKLGVKYGTWTR